MADEANLSKRERQKRRREAKLVEQRAAAAKARRTRLVLFGLCGLVVVGLVGAAIANQQAQRRQQAAAAEAVTARLDDLGCTPDTQQPDRGGGHLDPQVLAQSPPEVIYDDRPATSGQHVGSVVKTGVYDVRIDERLLVHNLEHGYVVAWYGSDAPDEQVAELKEFAQTSIDGQYPKLIVAPWDGALPDEANFAWSAWRFRQSCDQFDPEVLSLFLSEHHSGAGIAPEKTIAPHLGGDNGGGIDPQGEPVLLPPLDGATDGTPTEGTATEGTATGDTATEGTGTEATATEG